MYEDYGVRKAVVQFVSPNISAHKEQIPLLLAAGIEVEAYLYVWSNPVIYTSRAKWFNNEVANYPEIQFVWLDCEDTYSTNIADNIVPVMNTAQLMKLPFGIYTGAWYWEGFMGNWEGMKDVPLWAAQYDDNPDADVMHLFGGWTRAKMKQFKADATLGGVSGIDLNAYRYGDDVPLSNHRAFGARELMEVWNVVGGTATGRCVIDEVPSGQVGWSAWKVRVENP